MDDDDCMQNKKFLIANGIFNGLFVRIIPMSDSVCMETTDDFL